MKYKEIVKLWSDSRTAWFEYNISVGMAAGKVFKNIKEIMEVEDRLIRLINPDDDDEKVSKTEYSPVGAIIKDNDGWTRFGILLTLETDKNTFPKNNYKFIPRIKRTDNGWKVKFFQDSEEIQISTEITKDDVEPIVQEIEKMMRQQFENSINRWLSQEN